MAYVTFFFYGDLEPMLKQSKAELSSRKHGLRDGSYPRSFGRFGVEVSTIRCQATSPLSKTASESAFGTA